MKFWWNSSEIQGCPLDRCLLELLCLKTCTPVKGTLLKRKTLALSRYGTFPLLQCAYISRTFSGSGSGAPAGSCLDLLGASSSLVASADELHSMAEYVSAFEHRWCGLREDRSGLSLGALKGIPKTQIFAENRRFSQICPFSWKFQHLEGAPQETADFRRKPKIFAESRRKPQIGFRHLRSVTFSSALLSKDARDTILAAI